MYFESLSKLNTSSFLFIIFTNFLSANLVILFCLFKSISLFVVISSLLLSFNNFWLFFVSNFSNIFKIFTFSLVILLLISNLDNLLDSSLEMLYAFESWFNLISLINFLSINLLIAEFGLENKSLILFNVIIWFK